MLRFAALKNSLDGSQESEPARNRLASTVSSVPFSPLVEYQMANRSPFRSQVMDGW